MSGRVETATKTNRQIENRLKTLPKVVSDYYNLIASSKEPKTCLNYIIKVGAFIDKQTDDPEHYDVTTIDESIVSKYMKSITTKEVHGEIVETSFAVRQNIWSALNSFFKFLERKKYLEENPMKWIDRPSSKDEVHHVLLTENDIKKVYDYFTEQRTLTKEDKKKYWWTLRNQVIMMLLINTGMRETALAEIDYDDIDFDNSTVKVIDKRHKTINYHLSESLIKLLIEWVQVRNLTISEGGTKALVVSKSGKRVTGKELLDIVENITYPAMGVRLTPHKFRAAYCSILYDKTKDIEFVRDAVGHTSALVTQRYIVKKESAQSAAAEMLDDLFNDKE